jgi:hypothetical protein
MDASVEQLIIQLREMAAEDRAAILGAFAPAVNDQHQQAVVASGNNASPASTTAATTSSTASATVSSAAMTSSHSLTPSLTSIVFPPRLSLFSGEPDKDARYSLWRAEVAGLRNSHSESAILQAMRRSTKSLAADVLLHLPASASVADILARFDQMFGCIQPTELQYEQFYTARQRAGESVVAWACRLEQIINDLRMADKTLASDAMNNMLRSKFWSGLSAPAARDALRHLRDNNATFTDLLVAARQFEAEGKPTSTQASALQGAATLPELSELVKQIQALNKRIDALDKKKSKPSSSSGGFKGKCHKCHQWGHKQADCKSGNASD